MSNHYISTPPATGSNVDITDHYVFLDPADSSRTVFVLDVIPKAHFTDSFRVDAVYLTLIDTDNDLIPDITLQYNFQNVLSPVGSVTGQSGTVQLIRRGASPQTLVANAPVSFGNTPIITEGANGIQFFAGIRSEPFFFDTAAFLADMSFHDPGSDFFKGDNIFSIILEIPNNMLGKSSPVVIWTQTWIPEIYNPSRLIQMDQAGRPQVNFFYNSALDWATFSTTPPSRQREAISQSGQTFLQKFINTLMSWGYTQAQATPIAFWLLPDVLQYDFTIPTQYPNGRKLQDDVVSFDLNLLTNGKKPSDYVGPHTDYLSTFPYLGTPNTLGT